MQEIPVYLFTGFMDSGKTSLILETIYENNFTDGAKGLIIACEDGEVEFDKDRLSTLNIDVVFIEEKDDFTEDTLEGLADAHKPDMVFIEFNGTWELAPFTNMQLPEGWVIVQTLATVDSETFEVYMQNMRTMMQQQLAPADVIIFNRCAPGIPKTKFRANIKAINRPAQIVYERKDGSIDDEPEELPFDMDADVIEISDADYAFWYMDCSQTPKKYDGKTVHFIGLVYNPPGKMKKGTYVPGRFAMTCCVEDIQFLGFLCKDDINTDISHKSWVDFTAKIRVEFSKEYKGKGPVLYPEKVELTDKPEDELVYFN